MLEAGIKNIYVVTGYKADRFEYLVEKYGVKLLHNSDYLTRNNNASIWVAKKIIKNSYICSADNYFETNPFEIVVDDSYYAALYSVNFTDEWCMQEDEHGYISSVSIGGSKSWYMLGHTFWTESFSKMFIETLEQEYDLPETSDKLWEKIFIAHLDKLKMKIRKYDNGSIFEFDTLDELRVFDGSYVNDTRSNILKEISHELSCSEADITRIQTIKGNTTEAVGFTFNCLGKKYTYIYETKILQITN